MDLYIASSKYRTYNTLFEVLKKARDQLLQIISHLTGLIMQTAKLLKPWILDLLVRPSHLSLFIFISTINPYPLLHLNIIFSTVPSATNFLFIWRLLQKSSKSIHTFLSPLPLSVLQSKCSKTEMSAALCCLSPSTVSC